MLGSLWAQSLDFPTPVFGLVPLVPKSIVQSTFPSLPELQNSRQHPQPAPKLRHGDLLHPFKPLFYIPYPSLQHILPPLPLVQNRALLARPRPDPAPPCPQVVIRLALRLTQPLHRPLNPDLPLQLRPPKRQAGLRVTPHVLGLAARAPVAVDDEAPRVEFLQVHEARRHNAGRERRRGQAHGFGLVDRRRLRVREPRVELRERVGVELVPLQRAFGVLVRLRRGVLAGGGDC